MWHSRRDSATTFPYVSLVTKDDDCTKMAPYGLVSDGHVYGLFIPLQPADLVGFTQDKNIWLEAGFGQILFLSAVFVGFHSWYQSTLIPVPPSIRPM